MNVVRDDDEESRGWTKTRYDVFELVWNDEKALFKAAWSLWWGWGRHALAGASRLPDDSDFFLDLGFAKLAGVTLREDESLWGNALFDCIDIIESG